MLKMNISTFQLRKNPDTGLDYVINAVDELNKNHRSTDPEKTCGGIMPAIPKSPLCPATSFKV